MRPARRFITGLFHNSPFQTESRVAFLSDWKGHLIAAEGETDNRDLAAFASLTVSNIANDGLARLLGQKEFSILFKDEEREHLHVFIIGGQVILVVVFEKRSSMGNIRSRVKEITGKLEEIFRKLGKIGDGSWPGSGEGGAGGPSGDEAEMRLPIFDPDPPKDSLQ